MLPKNWRDFRLGGPAARQFGNAAGLGIEPPQLGNQFANKRLWLRYRLKRIGAKVQLGDRPQSLRGYTMRKHTIAAVAIAGIAAIGLAVAPAVAQTNPQATAKATQPKTAKRTPAPTQVAVVGRPPARVTVRKRSYLDPGTETKTHQDHYMDYAFPPGDTIFGDPTDFRLNWTRAPFPSCWDLAGFCR
jgi:hypothetical protein